MGVMSECRRKIRGKEGWSTGELFKTIIRNGFRGVWTTFFKCVLLFKLTYLKCANLGEKRFGFFW